MMSKICLHCLLLFTVLSLAPASAQSLKGQIDRVLRKLPSAVATGVLVVDLESGQTLYSRHADRALLTASNAKLVTVAAAIDKLGVDHQFHTSVYLRGEVTGGTLQGDLVLVGSGDPCFSGRYYDGKAGAVLDGWAQLVARAGIKRITGDIVLDASAVTGPRQHPDWPRDQLDNWYCAPVAAFNLNDNCIEIDVSANPRGGRARVSVRPRDAFPGLENRCTTGSRHKPLVHFPRGLTGKAVVISGSFGRSKPAAKYLWTMRDPDALFGRVLARKLARQGVETTGEVVVTRQPVADRGKPFARHRSTLDHVVGPVLERSQNLFAECLFRAVARADGQPGTFEGGARAVRGWLASIDATGQPADGSGLSRGNRYPPRTLVAVLRRAWSGRGRQVMVGNLPIAGQTGSLARRMRSGAAKGNVRAKTGYIRSVSALSGYVKTAGGRWLAFSMLFNGFQTKTVRMSNVTIKRDYQDAICQLLAAHR